MWAVIVTNQGYPVQVTLVDSQDELDEAVRTARSEWHLTEETQAYVLTKLTSTTPKSVSMHVDNKKSPKYSLAVVDRLKSSKSSKEPKRWQFCPECGCSWLHHLEGQAALDVEDWDPVKCSECGCEKALRP